MFARLSQGFRVSGGKSKEEGGMSGLLKDGTFMLYMLILGAVLILVVATGMPVLAYHLYLIQDSLRLAFSPGFTQVVVLILLAMPFFFGVIAALYAVAMSKRPVVIAPPTGTVHQHFGSAPPRELAPYEAQFREVEPTRQITEATH